METTLFLWRRMSEKISVYQNGGIFRADFSRLFLNPNKCFLTTSMGSFNISKREVLDHHRKRNEIIILQELWAQNRLVAHPDTDCELGQCTQGPKFRICLCQSGWNGHLTSALAPHIPNLSPLAVEAHREKFFHRSLFDFGKVYQRILQTET